MLTIYKKQLQKTWLFWLLPILLLGSLALLVIIIWPDYAPILEQFDAVIESNSIFASLVGESAIGSFEGFVGIELFIVGDFVFIILILLFGTMAIAREADSGTLDIILSYPVPRWRFLLEKLFAIITLSIIFPFLIWGITALGAAVIIETGVETTTGAPALTEFNNEAFLIALIGKWLVYMAFTCITILCSVIFMDTVKTLSSSGLIVGGSWILERFGGLIRSANEEVADILQGVSLFHYLDGASVMNAIMHDDATLILPIGNDVLLFFFPVHELLIVLLVGIIALLAALIIFQKREFT